MEKLFITLYTLANLDCLGQKVFYFKEFPKDSIEAIEKNFISAIDSRKEIVSAFPEGQEEVLQHWTDLHVTFQHYLKDHKFIFETDTKFFLRFYFNKDGAIARVGYNLKESMEKETRLKFENQLTAFSSMHNFGMKAKQPYTQCGTVTYQKNNNQ